MKTRHQLLFIFLSAISLLLITGFLLVSRISSKNKVLLNQGYDELQSETQKAIKLRSVIVENWVFDNSYWDELVTAYKNTDTGWVEETISAGMSKFNIDDLWLFDTSGKIFYNSGNEKIGFRENTFFMDPVILIDSLKINPFRHFFGLINNQLTEIYTAPVQPGTDAGRLTIPQGYFIAGQRINQNYLDKLSILTGKNLYELISLSSSDSNRKIDTKRSVAYYHKTFFDFNNQPLQVLKVTKNLEVLKGYKKDLRSYLAIFICIILVIAAVVYYFFRKKIVLPLFVLSEALEKKNDAVLTKLIRNKNEFGELATLISDFFTQNEELKEEISTRKKSQVALQKAARELEEATIEKIRAEHGQLAKTEFLATMSHEIRTPINGVIGVCNLLMEEKLTKTQKDYVDILNFSSRHLLSIVSDILDFSKIESGNMQFDKNSFDLKSTCLHVIELYEPRAHEKNIQLFFEPDEKISSSLHGDSVRLCQVLTNLLSNAIKFTDKGSVTLQYKNVCETASQATIEFVIKDTGIGIHKDKISKIFDSFSQADKSISTDYGGTGLGLAISKKLVELQGGNISVKSEPGKGSAFSFYLSFEKHVYVDSLPAPERTTGSMKNLQGMKVLVVEDNRINVQVLSGFLKKWNVLLDVATNGQEAIGKLKTAEFDVVLMDLQMPVMDGKEATRIIRHEKQTGYSTIPIIALTADATSETQNTINQFGFNQYLSKPFMPDALYRLLKKYYNQYEKQINN